MDAKYPEWIDEYARSSHQAFSKMMPCSWGPVDAFAVLEHTHPSFFERLHLTITRLKAMQVLLRDVARSFSSHSTIRVALWYIASVYMLTRYKDVQKVREIIEFLVAVLYAGSEEDAFGQNYNKVHTPAEVQTFLNELEWQDGSVVAARELGKLYTSGACVVFALYRDFFPQDSNEIYGPYDVSEKFGEGSILTIKHFAKIRPIELWPQTESMRYRDIKLYQVFNKHVSFRIEMAGMHPVTEGSLVENLTAYALVIDGKQITDLAQIKEIRTYLEARAVEYAALYDTMTPGDINKKFLEWLNFQFFGLCTLAGTDWRPTPEMYAAVEHLIVPDRYESDSFPSFEEFMESPEFEPYWLKSLYR